MAETNPWLTPPTWSTGVPWVRFGDLDRPLPRQDVAIIRELAAQGAEIAAPCRSSRTRSGSGRTSTRSGRSGRW